MLLLSIIVIFSRVTNRNKDLNPLINFGHTLLKEGTGMTKHTVEFRLLVQDNNPEHSRVGWKHKSTDDSGKRYALVSFEPGLREILRKAFRDMIVFDIRSISGAGTIAHGEQEPRALAETIILDDESMIINTKGGYRTPGSYRNQEMRDVNHAVMLLVWKWSPHFTSDNMDGTNDFSSSMRACVVCGRTQHGKGTGQRIGGFKLGLDSSPVREVIVYPHDHCFNQNCFSHEIERMIDPAYVFIPPKPGEDLETDLAQVLGKGVVKKDHPMGTGVTKVVKKDME